MGNSILTTDQITREALRVLENSLVITRNVNRQYDDSFAVQGAKIGSTLRIRKPDRALVTDGPVLQTQDENEQWTSLTVSSQKHIGMSFTSAEMTMSLDEFSDRIIKPRVSQLASSIDADVARAYLYAAQSVGTPGTTPATSQVLLAGQQKLNEAAVPLDSRYATVNPAANATLVEGMKGFFNPSSTVSRQFKTGMMGEGVLGYDEINMSQSISSQATGTRTNGTTSAAVVTQGQATVSLTGLGAGGTIKLGEVFTIAGVFAVNPQTRFSTGSLYQFVALADAVADGGGNATVNVPPIYDATQALAVVDVLPGNGAAVTFLGAASSAYVQNLIYHKDAIAFATADLILPKGVDMASRVQHNGISLRLIRDYDSTNDRLITRLDVLYGWAVIRPELMVRLWG